MNEDDLEEFVNLVPKVEVIDTTPKDSSDRGICKKVYVVRKLNMTEGIRELYCIAQTRKVCRGIQDLFRDEAERYGIDPAYYIWYEERPVVWSRTVFPDRYRIYDTINNHIVWGTHRTKLSGEYVYFTAAKTRAEKFKKEGILKEYVIQRYDRRKKLWIDVSHSNKKSKRKLTDFTYNTLNY